MTRKPTNIETDEWIIMRAHNSWKYTIVVSYEFL